MSITDNKHINISKKLALKIGYFFLITLLIILFWIFRNIQVDKMISRQQEQVSQTITNTVNEQAKLDLLMPDIVFINMDSTHKKQLDDSISKQIATVLTKKYIGTEKVNPSEINFQPFFIFPDSADNKGNYTITKTQLEELKNNIQFLTSQVDKAVATTKEEVANDIERLNTWVSIWIGVIGLIGIFIPIVINFKFSKELKEISKKAKQAKTSSGQALKTANAADTKTNKLEKIVLTLNDISKIKDIDSNFLLYNPKPLETLKVYLQEIHTNLINCAELFDEPIVKDAFRQLALKLHLITPYDFITPTNFDLLNQFALEVSNLIAQPLTQNTYNQALALLNRLNTNLTSGPNPQSEV